MNAFIGTKLIRAEAQEKDGEEGYKVTYEDGYESWSPKDVFDSAYRDMQNMTFGDAIYMMNGGAKVARKGWNGKGIFIQMQFPDRNSKMTSPYIYIDTTGLQSDNEAAPRSCVPWLASQTDMLANDWQIAG
jgi:hypothetical protein